jgi:hypothetical protein
MFECDDTKLSHNRLKGIAISLNVAPDKLEQMLNTCLTEELFCSDGESFWSNSMLRRKEKMDNIRSKRAEAGIKSGIARAKISKENRANAESGSEAQTNVEQMLNKEPTKMNKGKENKIKEKKINNTLDALESAFEDFWNAYPRRKDKKRALEKFKTAAKTHDAQLIVDGAKKYAQECERKKTDAQYIKHPATFLHQESFLNDFEEVHHGANRDAEAFALENDIPF